MGEETPGELEISIYQAVRASASTRGHPAGLCPPTAAATSAHRSSRGDHYVPGCSCGERTYQTSRVFPGWGLVDSPRKATHYHVRGVHDNASDNVGHNPKTVRNFGHVCVAGRVVIILRPTKLETGSARISRGCGHHALHGLLITHDWRDCYHSALICRDCGHPALSLSVATLGAGHQLSTARDCI